MKQEILNWLYDGQPYEEGVKLYAKYGHNSTVLKNLSRKETSSRKDKLAYKLVTMAKLPEHYINMDPEKLPIQKVNTNTNSKPSQSPKKSPDPRNIKLPALTQWKGTIPFKKLPKEIRNMIEERIEIEQKITGLSKQRHAIPQVNTIQNNKKRKSLSSQIETLLGEKNKLNKNIKYYEENLKLSEERAEDEQTEKEKILELTRKCNNLKSQRSKYRNKLSGPKEIPEGPKKDKARIKLKEIDFELIKIEKQLHK